MTAITIWHGSTLEGRALSDASMHNCACEMDPETGAHLTSCPVHDAMTHDQRWLDGLVFARRIAEQLRREEGLI